MSNYDKFLSTNYGRDLLQKHSLTETGLWRIRGEDPNCDMGGSHVKPDLGVAEGTLASVITYAVELPNFWQWGSGGDITKIVSIKVDPISLKRIATLKSERSLLEQKIATINEQLSQLGAQ